MTLRRPVRLRPGEGCDSPSEEPSILSLSELLNAALDEYSRATDVDPRDRTNPFVQQLEQCSMAEANILDVLQNTSDSITSKRQGPEATRAIRKMLKPIVGGLCVILDASAETASSVGVPGGKGIFAAIAVLVKTADRVSTSYDNLEKLFARLTIYVERLQVRLQAPIEHGTAKIAVKALVELLKAFELATKTMQRGRIRQFLHALVSKADGIQSALSKLEDITTADERMSIAEIAVGTQDISCDLQMLRKTLSMHTTSFEEARPAIQRTDVTVQATLVEAQSSNSKLDTIIAMLQTSQHGHFNQALPDNPRARGNSFWARFKDGNSADMALLHEAIQDARTAIKLSSESSDPELFFDLGERLQTRFELRHDMKDLDDAISAFQRADELTIDTTPEKVSRLNRLGVSLVQRFQRTRNDLDSERASTAFGEARGRLEFHQWGGSRQEVISSNYSNFKKTLHELDDEACRRLWQSSLTAGLEWRHQNMLTQSIEHESPGRETHRPIRVNLKPSGYPVNPPWHERMSRLASRFVTHLFACPDKPAPAADQQAAPARLDHFIAYARHRIRLPESVTYASLSLPQRLKARFHSNSGDSALAPFKHDGELADLELAISTFHRAIELAPDDHPLKPTLLDNLNAALRVRAAFGD